jgi:hypothetical protein
MLVLRCGPRTPGLATKIMARDGPPGIAENEKEIAWETGSPRDTVALCRKCDRRLLVCKEIERHAN